MFLIFFVLCEFNEVTILIVSISRRESTTQNISSISSIIRHRCIWLIKSLLSSATCHRNLGFQDDVGSHLPQSRQVGR